MEAHDFFFENSHRIFSLQDFTEKTLYNWRDSCSYNPVQIMTSWHRNALYIIGFSQMKQ